MERQMKGLPAASAGSLAATGRVRKTSPSRFTAEGGRGGAVVPIGDVLAELLSQYRVRFPDLNVTVVQPPAETL